jgi:hypothetical protein
MVRPWREVLKSTPEKIYLVLPLKVEDEEILTNEISDEELETVAGGEKEDEILNNMRPAHSSREADSMTHDHSYCVRGGTGNGNW